MCVFAPCCIMLREFMHKYALWVGVTMCSSCRLRFDDRPREDWSVNFWNVQGKNRGLASFMVRMMWTVYICFLPQRASDHGIEMCINLVQWILENFSSLKIKILMKELFQCHLLFSRCAFSFMEASIRSNTSEIHTHSVEISMSIFFSQNVPFLLPKCSSSSFFIIHLHIYQCI